ncbi:MAG TPA: hypothetical protein VFS21_36495 [Roseiflexaceae bacterium]|nr:hypothetical protein [Roseiflexaceae bacterium]
MIEQHHTLIDRRDTPRGRLHNVTTHAVLVETIGGKQRILGRYRTDDQALAAAASLIQLVTLRGGSMHIAHAQGVHPRRLRPLIGLGLLLLIGVPASWPVVAPITLALLLGTLSSDLRWR